MKKILAIGDPHFSKHNLLECNFIFGKILSIIQKNSYDQIVLLGDLLHDHSIVHMEPLNCLISWILKIREYCPSIVVLVGNHDRPHNEVFLTDEHPFNSLKYWGSDVQIIDSPVYDSIHRVCYVPYVPKGRYSEAISSVLSNPNDAKLFFSHQEFLGCKFNNHQNSPDGDKWPESYPLNISGHIHLPHEPQPNIVYVGTPIQHSFGEAGEKKRLVEIFLEDNNVKWNTIPLDFPDCPSYETIYLDISTPTSIPKGGKYKKIKLSNGNKEDLVNFYKQHKEILKDFRVEFQPTISSSSSPNITGTCFRLPNDILELLSNEGHSSCFSFASSSSDTITEGISLGNILTIECQNFGKFGKSQKFHHIGRKGIVMRIRGPSGAGKTTILNMIQFVLEGGRFPAVYPKKKTIVSLHFEQSGYTITRTKRPETLRISQHGQEKYKDSEAQEWIQSIFGTYWSTISVLSQKNLCRFFESNTSEKTEFLESILFSKKESEIIDKINEIYNTKKKQLEKEQSILDYLTLNVEGKMEDTIEETEESIKQRIEKIRKRKQYKEKMQRIQQLQTQLENQEKLDQLSHVLQLQEKLNDIDKDPQFRNFTEKEIQELEEQWSNYRKYQNHIKKYGPASVSENRQMEIQTAIQNEEQFPGQCPECSTIVSVKIDSFKKRAILQKTSTGKPIEYISSMKCKQLKDELDSLRLLQTSQQKEPPISSEKAHKFKTLFPVYEEWKKYPPILNEKQTKELLKEQQRIRQEIQILQQQLEYEDQNQKEEEEEETEDQLQEKLKIIPVIKQKKIVKEKEQEESKWKVALERSKRLRNEYLENRMDQISVIFQENLVRLFEEPIRSEIVLFREKSGIPSISFKFYYKHDEIQYDNLKGFSGGEQDRISFALLLSFHQICNTQESIILIDESFSSLDYENRIRCLDLLQEFAQKNKFVLFATHDPESLVDGEEELVLD